MAMQYMNIELTPRGVLYGLEVTPGTGLKVKVAPGVFRMEGLVLETKTETEVNLTAKKPTDGTVVVPVFANPDGTVSLTPEDKKDPGYVRFNQHDVEEDHNVGRSIKIAEVTLAHDASAIAQADISVKCRFAFDGQRTNFRGLHNEYTNPNTNW